MALTQPRCPPPLHSLGPPPSACAGERVGVPREGQPKGSSRQTTLPARVAALGVLVGLLPRARGSSGGSGSIVAVGRR